MGSTDKRRRGEKEEASKKDGPFRYVQRIDYDYFLLYVSEKMIYSCVRMKC